MPQPAWEPPPRPPRPTTVTLACYLLVLVVALGVVGGIASLTMQDEVRRDLYRTDHTLSRAQIDRFFHAGLVVGVVVAFGLGAFYLFLAYKMWRGRNWARVTTWVFMAVAALGVFTAFALPAPTVTRILTVVNGVCAIAIIVLLALRASNDFFRKPPLPPYGYYYPPPPR